MRHSYIPSFCHELKVKIISTESLNTLAACFYTRSMSELSSSAKYAVKPKWKCYLDTIIRATILPLKDFVLHMSI